MISERTHTPEVAVDTRIPLIEWQDCTDVVLDAVDSPFDGECTLHDGCRSIL
ncbi:hypothetical protein CLV85_1427 [Salinibacterium amurskyense]|uniref:Uncharacterized protein n=1 Tax=Salinibacterium amurskyense TaxID=205941 RepID=A0A2M9D926_9MICO|nr:hypothetical protein [Salinibacterium amurskyense]PJJ82234.1 hypothetical protein CLV85_1427 [Salinibacterium amurskyense]